MDTFTPGPGTARAFRDALGRYGTGVTVVTCEGPDGPVGITANSFASVSLDPPLILWSPAKSSSRYPAFAEAAHFVVHVIGEADEALARAFAKSGAAFDGIDWGRNDEGVPVLADTLARFDCAAEALHDAGDHTIVVGRVLRCAHRDGAPLMFLGGRYGRFTHLA